MKRMKYIISIIVITLTVGYTCVVGDFNVLNLRNDSGFDTSYDSGGGYSSSDYGSSSYDYSSSSSSSSSSHDYGSSGYGDFEWNSTTKLVILFIFLFIVIFPIVSFIHAFNKMVEEVEKAQGMPEEEIRKIIPNFKLQKFLNDRLNDFIDIQIAWQDFNYDKLRKKLTDSLYNQYVMQLDTLKEKNEKNVMCDFKMKKHVVTDIKEQNGKYIVEVMLTISFKDYIEKNGKVVRGSKNAIIIQKYKLKYIRSKKEQFEYCPNCGAKLTDSASQTCDYCRTTISRISTKWVLSEKKSVQQDTLY